MEPDVLALTGERTVPGVAVENYWFRRHEAVYAHLGDRWAGRRVLEAGCGEGYGGALLARRGARVITLDYDAVTAAHVARRYPGLGTVRGNLAALPLRPASVGAVVSLQVIEHLWDQPGFLRECARVLVPGGALVLSTPNRLTFSPGLDVPLNPFHTRELDAGQLDGLLRDAGFASDVLGLRHGARLRELDARPGGSIVDRQVALAVSGAPWPTELAEDVAGVGVEDFELTDDDVDSSLDLVALAVRR